MSATPAAMDDAPQEESECWCCGAAQEREQMVHLGNHPEVTICVRCAYSIKSWAWAIEDRSRTGALSRLRGQLRQLRRSVVRRGWHESRLIGRPIRWLGRRLP